MKNSRIFIGKLPVFFCFVFLCVGGGRAGRGGGEFSIYLNRRVFVMGRAGPCLFAYTVFTLSTRTDRQ